MESYGTITLTCSDVCDLFVGLGHVVDRKVPSSCIYLLDDCTVSISFPVVLYCILAKGELQNSEVGKQTLHPKWSHLSTSRNQSQNLDMHSSSKRALRFAKQREIPSRCLSMYGAYCTRDLHAVQCMPMSSIIIFHFNQIPILNELTVQCLSFELDLGVQPEYVNWSDNVHTRKAA